MCPWHWLRGLLPVSMLKTLFSDGQEAYWEASVGACRALGGRRALESRGGGQHEAMVNSPFTEPRGTGPWQTRGCPISWRIAPECAGGGALRLLPDPHQAPDLGDSVLLAPLPGQGPPHSSPFGSPRQRLWGREEGESRDGWSWGWVGVCQPPLLTWICILKLSCKAHLRRPAVLELL